MNYFNVEEKDVNKIRKYSKRELDKMNSADLYELLWEFYGQDNYYFKCLAKKVFNYIKGFRQEDPTYFYACQLLKDYENTNTKFVDYKLRGYI